MEPSVTIAITKIQTNELEDPEEGESLFHSQMWVKVDGGRTFQLNVRQTYKASEGQCQYQIRKPHHLHVHNLKTLMRYNPYAHVVSYVLLVDPLQVPNKEAFDLSSTEGYLVRREDSDLESLETVRPEAVDKQHVG